MSQESTQSFNTNKDLRKKLLISSLGLFVIITIQVLVSYFILEEDIAIAIIPTWMLAYGFYLNYIITKYLKW